MMRSENDQITSDKTAIADTMNKQFVNITDKFKLKPTTTETNNCQEYRKILSEMNDEKNLFSFKPVTSEEVLKTLYSLKSKRSLSYTILLKILKMFSGTFLPYLTRVINLSKATCSFPDE